MELYLISKIKIMENLKKSIIKTYIFKNFTKYFILLSHILI